MKSIYKLMFVSVVSFSLLTISSCSNTSSNEVKTTISAENIVTVDYAVDGMVCAMGCAKTIQDEVASMNGVSGCKVNFEGGKAHIEYDKTQLSEDDIIAKIEGVAKDQYKVSEWVEENSENDNNESEESGSSEEEVIGEVSISSFEIPNLFTLLFDQF